MKIKKFRYLDKPSVRKTMEDIGHALTILDISVILAVVGVTYFTLFSYYNAEIIKTEVYLKRFLTALKVIHNLGIIALGHMIYSLFYIVYKKIQRVR